jgi:hypothetical protein
MMALAWRDVRRWVCALVLVGVVQAVAQEVSVPLGDTPCVPADCDCDCQFHERIWQLQHRDMTHVQFVIDECAPHGIDAIQLSHDIIMNASDLPDSFVEQAVAYAQSAGVDCYIWTHELQDVPTEYQSGGRVLFDNPALWTWLRSRYVAAFDEMPDLDGVVLTFAETEWKVYEDADVISALPPEQRVAKLIEEMHDVCSDYGRKLVVRTFVYYPDELDFLRQAFERLALTLGPDDITVMSKEVPHDWEPFYPHNPILGNVAGFRQIVETDLGAEFYGRSLIPYGQPEYLQYRLTHALSRGVVGSVARIERKSWLAFGTPSEINIDAFSALLADPYGDTETIWDDGCAAKYGADAAPYAKAALKRTFEIVNLMMFPKGQWITNHSEIPSYSYAKGHLDGNAVSKWDADPLWADIQQRLQNPSLQTIDEINEEKDIALAMVDASIADLAAGQAHFAPADYADLSARLGVMRDAALAFKYHNNVFFRYLRYQNTGEGVLALHLGLDRIYAHADATEARWGSGVYLGAPGDLRSFANDIAGRIPSRPASGVTITSPADGASFEEPAAVLIEGIAIPEARRTVSFVEVFAGATSLGLADYDPLDGTWMLTWDGVSAGTYVLTATATDDAGQTLTSDPVVLYVTAEPTGPPAKATNPDPANYAMDVSITADLTWPRVLDAGSYDVYFGTASPGDFRGNQSEWRFDPGLLAPGRTYFWRVDTVNSIGTTTGDVWRFTTTSESSLAERIRGAYAWDVVNRGNLTEAGFYTTQIQGGVLLNDTSTGTPSGDGASVFMRTTQTNEKMKWRYDGAPLAGSGGMTVYVALRPGEALMAGAGGLDPNYTLIEFRGAGQRVNLTGHSLGGTTVIRAWDMPNYTQIGDGFSVPTGEWVHLWLSFDDASHRFELYDLTGDCPEMKLAGVVGTDTTAQFTIGDESTSASRNTDVRVDEVYIKVGPPLDLAHLAPDSDGDNVCDAGDNCPHDANPDQSDEDNDAVGDACDVCPGTPAGARVGANGCPLAASDFDGDGDVDLSDYGVFLGCYNGPNQAPGAAACDEADADDDGDVDLADYAGFLDCYNGPGNPPAC